MGFYYRVAGAPDRVLGSRGKTELPPEPLKELPDLSVAGFIRDEVSGSMVIVNDRLVREGAPLGGISTTICPI